MIKEDIQKLVNDLNKLDQNSDTVFLIDSNSRQIVASQSPDKCIFLSSMWVLLDRRKGRYLLVMSSQRLSAIKQGLMSILNNNNLQITPNKSGFQIIRYSEMLYNNNLTNIWSVMGYYSLKNSFIFKVLIFLLSKNYREIRKYVRSIKFS